MSKQMLIDAVHPEETRVALVKDGRIDDFDFETTGREQLRGNIYLAKVTRVEPSLQACFVEYGGNRHGFLAFSEIHPDYYQLPQADRDALIEEAARAAEEAGDDHDDDADIDGDDHDDDDDDSVDDTETVEANSESDEEEAVSEDDDAQNEDAGKDETGTDTKPESRRRPARKTRAASIARRYKIQEVIRRRQILLIQVVKEERGNKGAALTTYLSLAGRYSVLMPNTPRGGGISRKIANGNDRKRLKGIMQDLEVPKGMGLIVRTAGAKRSKVDISRDYDYLQKLWSKIRTGTMESMAPALIHEEGGLVHRAMRDMFDREIEEVIVQGEAAYREAKDLAKVLMPTQARKVKQWTASKPLFASEGVEEQLDSIFSPVVQMKSGGYLVINQTEALVAIDVNSGKSTKERSIEQTAVRTNLEAAEEACRQMRLRDLAGLVVIDFIDMDENKNNRAVEKRMKDALKLDRARVQNNRISQFGLMEISRQRRRAGVMQATSERCEACNGTGSIRSVSSAALQLLRAIEARAAGGNLKAITVTAPTEVALYILNTKRDTISAIEEEAGFAIAINSSAKMIAGDFEVSVERDGRGRRRSPKFDRGEYVVGDEDDHLLPEDDEAGIEADVQSDDDSSETEVTSETAKEGGARKRRRRGRRGGRRRRKDDTLDPGAPPADGGALLDGLAVSVSNLLGDAPDDLPTAEDGGLTAAAVAVPRLKTAPEPEPVEQANEASPEAENETTEGEPKKKRRRRRRRRKGEPSETSETETADSEDTATEDAVPEADAPIKVLEEAPGEATPEPAVAETAPASDAVTIEIQSEPDDMPDPEPEPVLTTEPVLETTPPNKKKRGWWSRG